MTDIASTCSLIVAVVALWVAWDVRRKSTRHIVRIVEVSSGYRQSADCPRGFHCFEIYFKNLGLAFPSMSVGLGFREKGGKGWMSHPLEAVDIPTGQSGPAATGVATGLVVKFGLRSYKMNRSGVRFLRSLEDLAKQKAALTVYCAGYRVRTIVTYGWKETIKEGLWKMGHTFFQKLGVGSYAKDQGSWLARIRLPELKLVSFHLRGFIRHLPKDSGANRRVQRDKHEGVITDETAPP